MRGVFSTLRTSHSKGQLFKTCRQTLLAVASEGVLLRDDSESFIDVFRGPDAPCARPAVLPGTFQGYTWRLFERTCTRKTWFSE